MFCDDLFVFVVAVGSCGDVCVILILQIKNLSYAYLNVFGVRKFRLYSYCHFNCEKQVKLKIETTATSSTMKQMPKSRFSTANDMKK